MYSHDLAERLESIVRAIRQDENFFVRPNVDGEDGLAIVIREEKPSSRFLELELSPYDGYNAYVNTPEEKAELQVRAALAEIAEEWDKGSVAVDEDPS